MKASIQKATLVPVLALILGVTAGCPGGIPTGLLNQLKPPTGGTGAKPPVGSAAKPKPALKPVPLASLPKPAPKSKPVVKPIVAKLSVKAVQKKAEIKAMTPTARKKSTQELLREAVAYAQELAKKYAMKPPVKTAAGTPRPVVKPVVTLPKPVVSTKLPVATLKIKAKEALKMAGKIKKGTTVAVAKKLNLRTVTPNAGVLKAAIKARQARRLAAKSFWATLSDAGFRLLQDSGASAPAPAETAPSTTAPETGAEATGEEASMAEVENPDVPGQKIEVSKDEDGNVVDQVSVDTEPDGSTTYGVDADDEGDTGNYKVGAEGADGGTHVDVDSDDPEAGGMDMDIAAGDLEAEDGVTTEMNVADPSDTSGETDWAESQIGLRPDGTVVNEVQIVTGAGDTGAASLELNSETGTAKETFMIGDLKGVILYGPDATAAGELYDADGQVVGTVIMDSQRQVTVEYGDGSTDSLSLK